jgi:hypothetical protein
MLKLGTRKGYRLVAHTGNMIFVRGEHVEKLGLSPAELERPEKLFSQNGSALRAGRYFGER